MAKSYKLTVKRGTKVSAKEGKKLGRSTLGPTSATSPKAGDVEGQYAYVGTVECPWCYALCRCVLDTDYYKWFQCWNCGNNFRA